MKEIIFNSFFSGAVNAELEKTHVQRDILKYDFYSLTSSIHLS